MKDIPLGAKVECSDGHCGESGIIILNPETRQITHFVVQDRSLPDQDQRLVPIDQVVETSRNRIRLSCTRAELASMDHFIETYYTHTEKEPQIDWPVDDTVRAVPRATLTEPRYAREEVEQIPPGEIAVRRGTKVAARDGSVGNVDELVVDSETGHISHMVVEVGHLWARKELAVPVSAVDYLFEDTVYLKIGKKEVEALPTVPVKRHA
jgi:sporulation protein YlmC with PRC-barrel domain